MKIRSCFKYWILVAAAGLVSSLSFASGDDLLCAAARGDLSRVITLLNANEDVNYCPDTTNSEEITSSLTVAIAGDHHSVVSELLARGADIDQFGQGNGTPLMHAALKGNVGLVRELLERGARVDARRPGVFSGCSAIHWAVSGGSLEVVRLLVANGADVNALNDVYDSPLMIAVEAGRFDIVKDLLRRGADKNRVKVHSYILKTRGTVLSNAYEILEAKRQETDNVYQFEQIYAFLKHPELLKMETTLLASERGEHSTNEFINSLANRLIEEDASWSEYERVKSLQELALEAYLLTGVGGTN